MFHLQDPSSINCTWKTFYFPYGCGFSGGSERRSAETTGGYAALASEHRMAQSPDLKDSLEACRSGISSTTESLVGMRLHGLQK